MSASSVAPLGPQGHQGLTAATTRPRTKSVNTDHTQFQDKYQLQPNELQAKSPSTAALDQIMSNLSQPKQHQGHHQDHQHHHQQQQQQHLSLHHSQNHTQVNSNHRLGHSYSKSGGASGRQFFPLLPSSLPATSGGTGGTGGAGFPASTSVVHDLMHNRSNSQTTVVESTSSPTMDYSQQQIYYRNSGGAATGGAAAILAVDQHDMSLPGTPPSHVQSFYNANNHNNNSMSRNSSSGSLIMGTTGSTPSSSTSVGNGGGSNPALVVGMANSHSSLHTLVGGSSPLQHRPHTPLKSSFPPHSNTSPGGEHNSADHVITGHSTQVAAGAGAGFSSAGADANPTPSTSSEYPGETISTGKQPSLLRSLSTQNGRQQFLTPEKPVGSLPTIHHQNGRGRHDGATFMGMSLKHLSLLVLLLQNSALVIMMRYSRVSVEPGQPMYLASTAVFFAELIKFITCLGILTYKTQSVYRTVYILRKEIWAKPQEILKMLVPSGLYALQNNLLYLALSNLEASTFQVTYQLKILSTAMFSVLMLNKRLSRQKWFSLCLLMVGVTLVQLQNVGSPKQTGPSPLPNMGQDDDPEVQVFEDGRVNEVSFSESEESLDVLGGEDEDSQNPILGLFAVLTSCVSSGFAGCYFEKILKGNETDMWVRNLQLGISGTVFSFLAMFYDRQKIFEAGIFQGYSIATWMVIVNQALGGLLVAIVVKYADNILKGFATSLSIITSGMISVYFFDFEPSIQFQMGTLVVILSTFLYGRPDAPIPRFVRREK
ncbi:hypothetical protein BG004_007771, partial [Podila humilis]